MPTSGQWVVSETTDRIVRRALRMVGAYTSTDLPRPEQLTDALFTLNCMLKAWASEGFTWLRKTGTLTLSTGMYQYEIGPSLDTPSMQSPVRPSHIYAINRRDLTSGIEVPLIQISRADYFAIPNKTAQGTPVQYYYDAQLPIGLLNIWPMPSDNNYSLIIDFDYPIQIQTDNLQDFDLPLNWADTIVYSLAVRLAPEYGLPLAERQLLEAEASALFNKSATDDRDLGSVYIGVKRI